MEPQPEKKNARYMKLMSRLIISFTITGNKACEPS
jgi:hypothetical protein